MTAREFLQAYAARRDQSLHDVLLAGYRVRPCTGCAIDACPGWVVCLTGSVGALRIVEILASGAAGVADPLPSPGGSVSLSPADGLADGQPGEGQEVIHWRRFDPKDTSAIPADVWLQGRVRDAEGDYWTPLTWRGGEWLWTYRLEPLPTSLVVLWWAVAPQGPSSGRPPLSSKGERTSGSSAGGGRESCVWSEDDYRDSASWNTSCGEAFWLEAGDPADNGMNHCPFCGLSLAVERLPEVSA